MLHRCCRCVVGRRDEAFGLKVNGALDTAAYASGIKVTDAELGAVQIKRDAFHGEWNHSVSPNPSN